MLLEQIVALLLQLSDGVGCEELARYPTLRQLVGHCLGTVLAELEGARVARIGPGAAGTVEALWLVHRQERFRALEDDALVT